MANAWKSYINDKNTFLEDVGCYESSVRYPTDVKLLWEANEWVYKQIKIMNKYIKGRMPRSKFNEQKDRCLVYSKTPKKIHKKTGKR